MKMMGHCDLPFFAPRRKVNLSNEISKYFGAGAYRAQLSYAMTRFMRKNGDAIAALAAAPPDKAAVYEIGDDEAGMRLDRWLRRRFPDCRVASDEDRAQGRGARVRQAGGRSTRLEAGERVRVPPLRLPPAEGPAVKRANPGDLEAIRAMTLFEDRDVIVLDKPYGLAVQGGSGTKRHIDGMLEALADKDGARPVLVHRLDRDTSGVLLIAKSRKMAAELGEIFRSRGARKIFWALVEGVPKPAQGRVSMFLAKGEGMGEARGAHGAGQGGSRADAGREARRSRRAAFADPLRRRRQGRPAARLAVDAPDHRPHPSVARALRGDRPSDHWRSEIQSAAPNDPARNDPLRAVPPGIEPKLHLLARRLILPHPRGGVIDVTAPLPEHMKTSFDMFGFDERERDPIEDAPDE